MSLPINIEALITQNIIESERIEFKQGWNPQVILHSVCAFANDFNNLGGGYLVVGIAEQDGRRSYRLSGWKSANWTRYKKSYCKSAILFRRIISLWLRWLLYRGGMFW